VKVEWYIESYEGGEGVLIGQIDLDKDIVTITKDKGLFIAHVYKHRYSSKRETKTDASLIELINWAEEELKFRESHGPT